MEITLECSLIRQTWRVHIPTKLPGEADAAGPGATPVVAKGSRAVLLLLEKGDLCKGKDYFQSLRIFFSFPKFKIFQRF